VSHIVILTPKSSGYFNFTAAEVSYSTGEDGATRQVKFHSNNKLDERFYQFNISYCIASKH